MTNRCHVGALVLAVICSLAASQAELAAAAAEIKAEAI
jgi:hypothetical protein